MRIVTYLNTTEEEIFAKKFNIVVGISLGNKDFKRELVRSYLLWAIENTKEKVLVLIPDKIHSVNYEIKNGYKKERACKLSAREGKKVEEMVKDILDEFTPEKRSIVSISKWEQIETDEYKRMVSIFYDEFKNNAEFNNEIIGIVKESIKSDKLNEIDYERLAIYVLEELPFLICGVESDDIVYGLQPYPGISKIDYLTVDLQDGLRFPDITHKLRIKNKLRHIEAYI